MINMGNVITITYSWHKHYNHGICGHTYEAIDYYYILSKFYDCKILLCVGFDVEYFRKIIENKYTFSSDEIDNVINNTVFTNIDEIEKEKRIFSKSVLMLDGFYYSEHPFITSNLVCFPCFTRNINALNIENLTILQDDRVYPPVYNSINYVKKILFSKIKKPKNIKRIKKISLLYTTVGCRAFDISKYNPNDVICLTNGVRLGSYTYLDMPIDNVFEHFDKYIYTPTSTKFDCSPRFIAECKYFNKEVEYDIDYFDIGLETRKSDLENLEKISLDENDYIIQFFKNS